MPQGDSLPETANFIIYGIGLALVLLASCAGLVVVLSSVYDVLLRQVRDKHREYVHLRNQYIDFLAWQMYGKPVEVYDKETGKRTWALTEKPEAHSEDWAIKMLMLSNGIRAELLMELERKYNAIQNADKEKHR